MTKVWH